MRKTIAVVSVAGGLLFGGAGIANATVHSAPIPASTTTLVAQGSYDNDKDSDKTGLWGLVGLLGLGGLAGLIRQRRKDTYPGAGPGAGPAAPGTRGPGPRA